MSQTPAPAPKSPGRPARVGRSLGVFLIAGLIAGGAGLGVVATFKDFFQVPAELANVSREDQEGTARLVAAEADVLRRNLLLTLGVVGSVTGAVMGLAGGVRDRSFGRGFVGLLLGLSLGGGLGVASAYLGPEIVGANIDASMPRDAPFEAKQDWKMYSTLAVHTTFWGLIGLAAALAATLPTRRIEVMLKSAVGALVAAILAMMVYQVLLATVFQMNRFELLLPQRIEAIALWTLLPALLLGIAIGRLSEPQDQKQPETSG